jgi:hypothetical protein
LPATKGAGLVAPGGLKGEYFNDLWRRGTPVVTRIDPQIVRAAEWIEWRIPLTSLGGVNFVEIKKLYIGVGNRTNPTRGGAGRIYIDDIRVTK